MRRPTAPEGRAPEAADSASSDDVAGDTDTYTDSEEEIEAPGYAQFVDDESEEVASASSSDDEAALQKEIESVPFAQLLKARRAVRTSARPANEAVSQDTLHERREAAKAHLRAMDTTKPAPQRRPDTRTHTPLGTREHKTAPAVMPTRRPVSRKRQVVETVQHSRQRDPRFDSLSAGPVNLDLLGKSYNFLPSLYDNELASLRTAYDKLKRLEARHAGPHAKSEQALRIREERANAELALRRAESQRSERLQQQNKRSVQSDIKKENQRRVDAGLRPYFPKKAERYAEELRHKYDQLAQAKGKRPGDPSAAVKKAMEKKARKDAQKDKKSLDAALGGGSRTDLGAPGRRLEGTRPPRLDAPPHKRSRRG